MTASAISDQHDTNFFAHFISIFGLFLLFSISGLNHLIGHIKLYFVQFLLFPNKYKNLGLIFQLQSFFTWLWALIGNGQCYFY